MTIAGGPDHVDPPSGRRPGVPRSDRRARWRLGTLVLTVCVVVGVATAAEAAGTSAGTARNRATPVRWMMTADVVRMVDVAPLRARLTHAAVSELLRPGEAPVLPHSTVVAEFPSAATLRATIGAHRLPARTTAVLYDPGVSPATPAGEQRRPVQATVAAATMAHRHGLAIYVSPALTLATAFRPVGPLPTWRRFIDSGLVPRMSGPVDGIELQAQSLERDPAGYRHFVSVAAAAARASHPGIAVLAGLSTDTTAGVPTSTQLLADVAISRSTVTGYRISVPHRTRWCPRCGPSRAGVARDTLDDVL